MRRNPKSCLLGHNLYLKGTFKVKEEEPIHNRVLLLGRLYRGIRYIGSGFDIRIGEGSSLLASFGDAVKSGSSGIHRGLKRGDRDIATGGRRLDCFIQCGGYVFADFGHLIFDQSRKPGLGVLSNFVNSLRVIRPFVGAGFGEFTAQRRQVTILFV